jgi:hypothetical protein
MSTLVVVNPLAHGTRRTLPAANDRIGYRLLHQTAVD